MIIMITIIMIIIIIIMIIIIIIIIIILKYQVDVRRGIAVPQGQVGVFSLGW